LGDGTDADEQQNCDHSEGAHAVILVLVSRRWIVVCGLAFISCGSSPPPPAVAGGSTGTDTITGNERLGWDQAAADASELATFGYAIYVDGTPNEATGVTCAAATAAGTFPCTARLPSMSAGAHTLELTAFVNDGSLLESARSSPLHVTVAAQTASIGSAPELRTGLTLHSSVVDGLISPTDIAFAADNRIFVAERGGRVRIVSNGQLLDEPAISLADEIGPGVQLLAIALDPQFEQTHYAFVVYTALDRSGAPAFTLARFREVANTFGDRAILLDNLPQSASAPAAALRFGPDGKLYAAYDDGGDAPAAAGAASLNGKVLRLNTDGTTPSDSSGPIYVGGFRSPLAMDWDPSTNTLWVADAANGAAPFVFYRSALLPDWTGRLMTANTLFSSATAAQISRVATAPDGTIYYLTTRGLGRLAPDRAP
jgi:hypothetical protein